MGLALGRASDQHSSVPFLVGVLPSRDYIIRQIEQMGTVLRALLGMVLNRSASPGEVRAQLHETLQQVGFDIEIALVADADTLIRMVAPTGEVEPGRMWLIAEAMYVEGLDAALDGRETEARFTLEKALRLFQMFDASAPVVSGFPEARERIEEIEDRLRYLNGAPGSSQPPRRQDGDIL